MASILQSSNTIIGNILQKSNAILVISYQQPKTTTFFDKQLFHKSPNIIWQLILYYARSPKLILWQQYISKVHDLSPWQNYLINGTQSILKAHGSSPWQLLIKAHGKSHGNYLHFTKISWQLSLSLTYRLSFEAYIQEVENFARELS